MCVLQDTAVLQYTQIITVTRARAHTRTHSQVFMNLQSPEEYVKHRRPDNDIQHIHSSD